MKVEFSPEVAEMMLENPNFCEDVDKHIKIFDTSYETKLVFYNEFGLLLHLESEAYLKVYICR